MDSEPIGMAVAGAAGFDGSGTTTADEEGF
jgi:hypothetical protein